MTSSSEISNNCAWPRITIVTAVFNGAKYLAPTIRSVISQGYPNLEYFIVDGGSTDGTLDIIRNYEKDISGWWSGPDEGVYDALNKGFARSSGEILGWLNASDLFHINGLFVVGSIFPAFPQAEWITGRPTDLSPECLTVNVRRIPRWSRYRVLAGANKYIQQESTFWRRSLWDRAGGALKVSFGVAADFELWLRFFRLAQLYSVDALIAGYRGHSDALSSSNYERYNNTCDEIIERELDSTKRSGPIKLFRQLSAAAQRVPKLRGLWQSVVMQSLYRLPGPDLPPVIKFDFDSNKWLIPR